MSFSLEEILLEFAESSRMALDRTRRISVLQLHSRPSWSYDSAAARAVVEQARERLDERGRQTEREQRGAIREGIREADRRSRDRRRDLREKRAAEQHAARMAEEAERESERKTAGTVRARARQVAREARVIGPLRPTDNETVFLRTCARCGGDVETREGSRMVYHRSESRLLFRCPLMERRT